MYIRDLQGNEYFLQGTIKHDQELNGDERIDMDIHYTDINAEFLQKKEDLNMWIIIFENKEYRIISTKQTGHGDKYTVSVTGILYVLDWLNTHRIYRRIDASLTDVEAFRLVFNDTPFTFNIVDNSYSNRFEGLGEGQTRLEMFKTFLDRYDYEMNIVGNVVYLKNKVGNDANFEYRYKVNANNISKDSDAGELWTYAQGYGNYSDDEEGKDVVDKAQLKREYTSPLESIIGERREAPPIRDGRITQQNTMDNALKKLVDESMQISFSADIQDMREQGYNYQVATIGDRVFLVDERIGLDTEIRVVKISRTVAYTGQLLDIQITFGTTTNADNYSSNLTTAVKDITDIMKGRKSIPFTALDTVSKSMVSKIQNTSSELLFDDMGIHAIDKKNANNIVTMNSSGWMLSTDGGRTAKTAMTAEGIVADTITTGHLNTNLITVEGGDELDFTFIRGGKIRSTGKFTRTFPEGDALYEAYTESFNGSYRSGLINKTAGNSKLNNITRWLALTDKGITTQREIHSKSPDKRGARFIDMFADESFTSDVFGQGMHIYSGQDLMIESKYRLTLTSSDAWNTRLENSGLEIYKDGAGLVLSRQTDFNSTAGSGGQYISIQSQGGNEQAHMGVTSNRMDLSLTARYGEVHLRGNNIKCFTSAGDSLQGITANDFDVMGVGRLAFSGGDTYVQGMTGVRFTKYKSNEFVNVQAKDFIKASSRDLKTNIETLNNGLEAVKRLTPVSYEYKAGGDKDIGFIAEDSPDIAVMEGKAISVQKITTWAVLAIKELNEKVEELQNG